MRPAKRLGPLLLLSLAALSSAPHAAAQGGAGPAAWTRYTYPGEEFSVELPATPAVSRTTRLVPNSRQTIEEGRHFSLYFGGVVFIIASHDNPRGSESLDHFDRNVWGGHGLTAAGDTELGGFPGRVYRLDPRYKGAARSFRTGRHAYRVEVFSDEEGHEREVERFINSFSLAAKPAGELIVDVTSAKPDPPSPASATPPPGATAPGRVGGATGEVPFRRGGVARKAVIVFKPEPDFTEEARRNNTAGLVRLRCILSSSGKVTNVAVVKGMPDGLTGTAIQAARRILFFPALKDGVRVSQYVVLEYNFNIY